MDSCLSRWTASRLGRHDQKGDLTRHKQVLDGDCAKQSWRFEAIADLGSGMSYRKNSLKRLPDDVMEGRGGRRVIAHNSLPLVRQPSRRKQGILHDVKKAVEESQSC